LAANSGYFTLTPSTATGTAWKSVSTTPATYGEVSCLLTSSSGRIPAPCQIDGTSGIMTVNPALSLGNGIPYQLTVTTKGAPNTENGLL
jgi:hypothetical protein